MPELLEFCLCCTKNSSLEGKMFEHNATGYFIKNIFLNTKLYTVNNLFTQTILYYLMSDFHSSFHYTLRLTIN